MATTDTVNARRGPSGASCVYGPVHGRYKNSRLRGCYSCCLPDRITAPRSFDRENVCKGVEDAIPMQQINIRRGINPQLLTTIQITLIQVWELLMRQLYCRALDVRNKCRL